MNIAINIIYQLNKLIQQHIILMAQILIISATRLPCVGGTRTWPCTDTMVTTCLLASVEQTKVSYMILARHQPCHHILEIITSIYNLLFFTTVNVLEHPNDSHISSTHQATIKISHFKANLVHDRRITG